MIKFARIETFRISDLNRAFDHIVDLIFGHLEIFGVVLDSVNTVSVAPPAGNLATGRTLAEEFALRFSATRVVDLQGAVVAGFDRPAGHFNLFLRLSDAGLQLISSGDALPTALWTHAHIQTAAQHELHLSGWSAC